MMVPKKSLVLVGAALALLGASASAQQSQKEFKRLHRPLKAAHLDLATGTITRSPVTNRAATATVTDFKNDDIGLPPSVFGVPQIGIITRDVGDHNNVWITAGVKGAANQSDIMNEIQFAYCSTRLDTGSGGPGGSLKLTFYEGYTATGGAPSTAVSILSLTGLPANTAEATFAAWTASNTGCWNLTLGFAAPVCFQDGAIAYAWEFSDHSVGSANAGTFTFLACTTSCSGVGAPPIAPDGAGMTDVIDVYSPPGTLASTFSFATGGPFPTFTSVNMEIREVCDVTATVAGYDAITTPSPDTLVTSTAVLSSTWTSTHTRASGTGGNSILRISVAGNPKSSGANGTATSGLTPAVCNGAVGRNMLSLSTASVGALNSLDPFDTTGNTVSGRAVAIPCDLSLLGVHWAVQGTSTAGTGGVKRMSPAVEGTVGTL